MANVVKAVIKWEIDMENSVVEPKLDCNELDRYYMSMPDGYIVVKIPYAKSGMDEWDIVYVNQKQIICSLTGIICCIIHMDIYFHIKM